MSIKKILTGVMLCASILAAPISYAGLISSDVSNENDSLALLHEETGIEWMKMTETAGMSILDVEAMFESTLDGWRLATRSEVNTFVSYITGFDTIGIDTTTFGGYSGNTHPLTTSLIKAMGFLDSTSSRGLYRDNGTVLMSGGYIKNSSNTLNYTYDDHGGYNDQFAAANHGVFIVSDGGRTLSSINNPERNINNSSAPINSVSVPEPTTLAVFSLGLFGLMLRKKKD
jgi:hypothetical protein